MLSSDIPDKIPLPFAYSGTKNAIPTASQIGITPGAASLTDGFPPLTFTPVSAGGIPPSGADFNGIFNMITAVQQWQSAGGHFKYDSAFSTAIGGYPAGAILMSTDNKTQWLNLADNNTTDPDGGTPANWIANSGGRIVRTTIYINNAGTLQASIDGGAFANASSTFTPLTVTRAVDVEVQAGGGAGGGAAATGAGQVSAGAGGGAGGYCRKWITSAFSGVTITVGGDAAGVVNAPGTNGNSSSFGAILSATGGNGGSLGPSSAASSDPKGNGAGGTATGGNINITGGGGLYATYASTLVSGDGGRSEFGRGALWATGPGIGNAATNYGSGGSGGANLASAAAKAGGNGKGGIIIVREYA